MSLNWKNRLQNFISQQCLPSQSEYRGDGNGRYSRIPRDDSQGKLRRAPSSGFLRSAASSCSGGSDDSNPLLRKSSSRALLNQIRSSRPPTRREQLLIGVVLVCMLQMACMRQPQSGSFMFWRSDGTDAPEPGRPPPTYAYLPAKEVLRESPDRCGNALGVPRVALMFLTTGDLYHEETWRLWFKSAAGVLPSQTIASNVCQTEGVSSKLTEISAACRGAGANSTNAIDQQHLFSVYIHAPPSFPGYDKDSLWAGRLVQNRVKTSWGAHNLVEATRHLMWEAFRDPLNTRFLLLSESDIPLYDPMTLWQQLQSETHSRLDICKHEGTSPWRWDPRMETTRLHFYHWRKSPQWLTMTREHVDLVLQDQEVFRKFEKHCWSAWDDKHNRWHRDCFSDEHYFATLLAVEERDDEGICGARGVSYTNWEGNSAHPKSFGPNDVHASLIRKARAAPVSATGEKTAPCDWGAAQQQAAGLFVSKDMALGAQSVDLCSRMWRHKPEFTAKMPETCFLTGRKFPYESRDKVRKVFLQCGNGIDLLRQDVCEESGGHYCGSVWGKVKGLFTGDTCL